MKMNKNIIAKLLLPLMALAAIALPGTASAEARGTRNDWVNSSVVVWKNPFGQCWQGRHWMPSASGEDCGGDAPTLLPALLRPAAAPELRTLAMNAVADSEAENLTSTLDYSNGSEPGRTMITSCFTTHN